MKLFDTLFGNEQGIFLGFNLKNGGIANGGFGCAADMDVSNHKQSVDNPMQSVTTDRYLEVNVQCRHSLLDP